MNVHQDMAHAARLSRLDGAVQTPLGPLSTSFEPLPKLHRAAQRAPAASGHKRHADLNALFDAFGIEDGAVLSFHHHYRNGDNLVNLVMALAKARGLKGLTLAASSLFPVHAPLVPLIEDGTIRHIITDYMRGPVADCVTRGALQGTALLQSHGGRARAIAARQISIDAAFVAAPLAQADGTATGRGGKLACGPLGYAAVDAAFARHTAVIAAEITDVPLPHEDVPAAHVDAVVELPEIGCTSGILSGSTRAAESDNARRIGSLVAGSIRAAGLLKDGISLQSGAGGYSLGAVGHVGRAMAEAGVTGSFLSGGITGIHAELLEQKRFARIRDVQCFDLAAVRSASNNPDHEMMTAEEYASPLHPRPAVLDLDVMLLGALEIDATFNVNVVISAGGAILGGPGGHPDTAAGAKLRIVTTDLNGGGFAKLVPQVRCVSTPGHDIDLVVTPQGIAVHDDRPELFDRLKSAGLPLCTFDELAAQASAEAASAPAPMASYKPRAFIEAREGQILDWI